MVGIIYRDPIYFYHLKCCILILLKNVTQGQHFGKFQVNFNKKWDGDRWLSIHRLLKLALQCQFFLQFFLKNDLKMKI